MRNQHVQSLQLHFGSVHLLTRTKHFLQHGRLVPRVAELQELLQPLVQVQILRLLTVQRRQGEMERNYELFQLSVAVDQHARVLAHVPRLTHVLETHQAVVDVHQPAVLRGGERGHFIPRLREEYFQDPFLRGIYYEEQCDPPLVSVLGLLLVRNLDEGALSVTVTLENSNRHAPVNVDERDSPEGVRHGGQFVVRGQNHFGGGASLVAEAVPAVYRFGFLDGSRRFSFWLRFGTGQPVPGEKTALSLLIVEAKETDHIFNSCY